MTRFERVSRSLAFAVAACLCGLVACGQQVTKPRTYPARVLIIRHAEKLENGVSEHLNEAGRKRAEALPALFVKSEDRPEPFPKPDFILAAANSANSHRPVETIMPLAKALQLPVTADIDSDDVNPFVRHVYYSPKYEGKNLLVSWRHSTIPALAKAFGATDVPQEWKDKTYDRVWVLDFDAKGQVTFRDDPQRLMPGDSKR